VDLDWLMNRILVVEDEAALRAVITRTLKKAGYDVKSVGAGANALIVFDNPEWQPDLIITDFQLPDIDGLELLRRCRDRGSRIPFVLCTGDVNALGQLDGRALGASILAKPWNSIGDLLACVRNAIAA